MTDHNNSILGLELATDPRWANLAEMDLEYILSDHAYCEQKAASQCISLIQRFPDKEKMVEALAPLVTEEWGHFRLVVQEMKKRGFQLSHQRKDEYVNMLFTRAYKGHDRELKFLDKLLICALIEARSCERFRLLSLHMEEENLANFYHKFMISEAGHYRLFHDLAKQYFDESQVKERWEYWLETESDILHQLSPRGDRIH